ncbi:MAG: hypothetical protein NZ840_09740 [Anaerolineales bacterium]|nr:hypothetical protein [Anaerolineales bacterium]MDW8162323.1 hypothetical protein [Anaerolineales bacterium]
MVYTDLLFPSYLTPLLAASRGRQREALVEAVHQKLVGDLKRKALVFLIARLSNCVACKSES